MSQRGNKTNILISEKAPIKEIAYLYFEKRTPNQTRCFNKKLYENASVCRHVSGFNALNSNLTVKLLQRGYRYHKLQIHFSNVIADTMNRFVRRITILHEGLLEPGRLDILNYA